MDREKAGNPVLFDTWRQSNCHNINCPFMGGMSEVPSSFYKQQGGAGLFNKNAARIGQFHGSSFVAREEVKAVVFFEIRNLPAESGLAYIQSESSSREIQFLGEDNDSVKVTDLDVWEHGSSPV